MSLRARIGERLRAALGSRIAGGMVRVAIIYGLAVSIFFYTAIYGDPRYAKPSADRSHAIQLKSEWVYVGDAAYYVYEASDLLAGAAVIAVVSHAALNWRPAE